MAGFLHLFLALRWHRKLGIPSWLFYGFIGNVLEGLEKFLTLIPVNVIVALVIPKGVEATVLSLTSTVFAICTLNKGLMGILINKMFVHANNLNLEDTLWKLYCF